jgi:hypothetical protein
MPDYHAAKGRAGWRVTGQVGCQPHLERGLL